MNHERWISIIVDVVDVFTVVVRPPLSPALDATCLRVPAPLTTLWLFPLFACCPLQWRLFAESPFPFKGLVGAIGGAK